MSTRRQQNCERGGFTLAEMLIVLAIMAITTTIAVQSLGPVASQARYHATQQTLAELRSAIIGPPVGTNNAGTVSGFVNDMGRLPQSLVELVTNPSNLASAQSINADNDTTTAATPVTVISGWNGPYVRTPIGSPTASIVDGWNQQLSTPTLLTTGAWSVWSFGPNGQNDAGLGDDIPLVINLTDFQATSLTVTANELNAGQAVSPTLGINESVRVYVYTVNGRNVTNDMGVVVPGNDGLFQLAAQATTTQGASMNFNYTFSAPSVVLNIGTVIIQAAHYKSDGVTISKRSSPVLTTLTPRSTLNLALVMQ